MKLVPIETLIEKSRDYVLSAEPKYFPWFIIEGKDFDNAIAIAEEWKIQRVVDELKKQKEKYADIPVGVDRSFDSPRYWVSSWTSELKYRKRLNNKFKINDAVDEIFSKGELLYFSVFKDEILCPYYDYVRAKKRFDATENRLKELENLIAKGYLDETQKSLDFIERTLEQSEVKQRDSAYIPPTEVPTFKEEANV